MLAQTHKISNDATSVAPLLSIIFLGDEAIDQKQPASAFTFASMAVHMIQQMELNILMYVCIDNVE